MLPGNALPNLRYEMNVVNVPSGVSFFFLELQE